MRDSFGARGELQVGEHRYEIFRLSALEHEFPVRTLPYSIKVLLENLLRRENGADVTARSISQLARWNPEQKSPPEIGFVPARVLLQDFTGVPAAVDLAAMRDAVAKFGAEPDLINPLTPVDLVIDHSVQVDVFARADAAEANAKIEFERNAERYELLRWTQGAFRNFRVTPPGVGIVHQVNLEHLASVVFVDRAKDRLPRLYPDTLVGTDSHTTMVNGLGVLGWGVGGIEAEAAMLGQPVSMRVPPVVGFKLSGSLPEGTTATDLVLTITQRLREAGVVGKFVEFFGDGLIHLSVADRSTIANMAPEYGATCGLFPIDAATLDYLRLTGRSSEHIALVESYAREQGLFQDEHSPAPFYSSLITLDLGEIEPSIAGPRRPQDRFALSTAGIQCRHHIHQLQARRSGNGSDQSLSRFAAEGGGTAVGSEEAAHSGAVAVQTDAENFLLKDGAVVIAAITSCTNTSNPSVMIAAGILAQRAAERGLKSKPWVKTSLAPGSRVVTDYLRQAALMEPLEGLGFNLVGYGCTTCIGNSGPLARPIESAISRSGLITAAVLSGNRNFEGRIHPLVPLNYLASPPMVVAYALAGTMAWDPFDSPLGYDRDAKPVYLREIWPSSRDIEQCVGQSVRPEMYRSAYRDTLRKSDGRWDRLASGDSELYPWREDSTYVQRPPFFDGLSRKPSEPAAIENGRCLALLGDSVTTDHISPAGAIPVDTPAGQYLLEQGVEPEQFNSYGSRRGNHEVMVRGTFANVRLRNRLVPEREGGWTLHHPTGEILSIFEAAERYRAEGVPLIVLAGREYGTGSSRDWASKGTRLLGVRAVIARSFERIHRSNLIGMGVLPLQFSREDSAEALGLTGTEIFHIQAVDSSVSHVEVNALSSDAKVTFRVRVRIDTPEEWQYYRNGGILQYVLRRLLGEQS
jgi:aconitate hydratase